MDASRQGDSPAPDPPPFVQFLGWPRSGTTLVMSLLNAYPGVAISHEADVSALVAAGCDRKQIRTRMAASQKAFAEAGHQWFGYDYLIDAPPPAGAPLDPSRPDQRFVVLGDKKAGGTAEIFALHPDIFHRTASTLGCSLRVLVVLRNPFDVITSISRNLPGDAPAWFCMGPDPLESAIDWFVLLSMFVQRAVDTQPCPIHILTLADLVANPADTLARTLRFIGVLESTQPLDARYAALARAKVFTTERRPALSIKWTDEQIRRVHNIVASTALLSAHLMLPSHPGDAG